MAGKPSEERSEVDALAEDVVAERDKIVVPEVLVHEPEKPTVPDKALWAQVRDMKMSERVKLALRGNRETRALLLRDPSRHIQRLVLQNPRITEEEIMAIAKDRNADEEILAIIADSREWSKVYAVRLALVENARTPAPRAFRILGTLVDRDLYRIGKSKNVPAAIATQARRMVNARQQRH